MTLPNSPSAEIAARIPDFLSLILDRLTAAGQKAYVVGGAVRDAHMGRPIGDWDVATSASPRQIAALFPHIRQFHLKHETVTLVDSGRQYHVTAFRGTEPSIESDLAGRDFTMNAMAFDPEAEAVLDPFYGREDLKQQRVRAVGDPRKRFEEDPLRILRAVRFACQLDFHIESHTRRVMTRMARSLQTVAPERVREEWAKVLVSRRAAEGTLLMRRMGLLEQIVPEVLEGYRKRQGPPGSPTIFRHGVETLAGIEPKLTLRLSALLHDVGKPRVRIKREGQWHFPDHEMESARMAHSILSRLRFSNILIRRVTHLIRNHRIEYHTRWSDADVRRFITAVGKDRIDDLIRLHSADLRAWERRLGAATSAGTRVRKARIRLKEMESRIQKEMQTGFPARVQDLAADGSTVMAVLDISPGHRVGEVLQQLLEKTLEHPEWNTEHELKCILKGLKADPSS